MLRSHVVEQMHESDWLFNGPPKVTFAFGVWLISQAEVCIGVSGVVINANNIIAIIFRVSVIGCPALALTLLATGFLLSPSRSQLCSHRLGLCIGGPAHSCLDLITLLPVLLSFSIDIFAAPPDILGTFAG